MMLITFNEACKELKIKPSTLYQWSSSGLVPVVRIGRLLRYDREQLINWFRDGKFEKAKLEFLRGKKEGSHE